MVELHRQGSAAAACAAGLLFVINLLAALARGKIARHILAGLVDGFSAPEKQSVDRRKDKLNKIIS